MNTYITYRYADRTNCKQYTRIIVEGTITWEQIQPYLVQQDSFIPGQVGLEDLQDRFMLPGVDHPWHQITSEDIRPTEKEPTIALSGAKLAEEFTNTIWNPNQPRASKVLNSTVTPDTEVRTASEMDHLGMHIYAHDKLPSPRAANGTRARKTSSRT